MVSEDMVAKKKEILRRRLRGRISPIRWLQRHHLQATPVLSPSDNYNLGTLTDSAFDYLQTPVCTTTDNKPYLSRDRLITPQNNPAATAAIGVRLYFTTYQFVQLQATDLSITSPGDLIVVKQPAAGTNAGIAVYENDLNFPLYPY